MFEKMLEIPEEYCVECDSFYTPSWTDCACPKPPSLRINLSEVIARLDAKLRLEGVKTPNPAPETPKNDVDDYMESLSKKWFKTKPD